MPSMTVKTGIAGPDGREEQITEYLCDSPDCPNVATHGFGCVREIGLSIALCDEHAAKLGGQS
jgi:hypothetical protein